MKNTKMLLIILLLGGIAIVFFLKPSKRLLEKKVPLPLAPSQEFTPTKILPPEPPRSGSPPQLRAEQKFCPEVYVPAQPGPEQASTLDKPYTITIRRYTADTDSGSDTAPFPLRQVHLDRWGLHGKNVNQASMPLVGLSVSCVRVKMKDGRWVDIKREENRFLSLSLYALMIEGFGLSCINESIDKKDITAVEFVYDAVYAEEMHVVTISPFVSLSDYTVEEECLLVFNKRNRDGHYVGAGALRLTVNVKRTQDDAVAAKDLDIGQMHIVYPDEVTAMTARSGGNFRDQGHVRFEEQEFYVPKPDPQEYHALEIQIPRKLKRFKGTMVVPVKHVTEQETNKPVIPQGWLGVSTTWSTYVVPNRFGLNQLTGTRIYEVVENGPAEKAGIKQGDVIISFDGKAIQNFKDLTNTVSQTPVNKKVPIVVVRDGKKQTIYVIVGKRPPTPTPSPTSPQKPTTLKTSQASGSPDLQRVDLSGNFITNGNFNTLEAWEQIHNTNVKDTIRLHTEENHVIWERTNSQNDGGAVGVYQELDLDVTNVNSLNLCLDVWIEYHTLKNTGWWSEKRGGSGEMPVHITLLYLDEAGKKGRWDHGFLIHNRGLRDATLKNFTLVPKAERSHFCFDMMDDAIRKDPKGRNVLPKPARITRLMLYGNGWDFKGGVGNIVLRKSP